MTKTTSDPIPFPKGKELHALLQAEVKAKAKPELRCPNCGSTNVTTTDPDPFRHRHQCQDCGTWADYLKTTRKTP